MFIWIMEDMELLNQKDGVFVGDEMIYDCETMLCTQDKIDFIDKMQEGKMSYLLGLIEQINKDKDTLKFDNTGYIKTVSLKAWIKKNDSRGLLDDWYKYGNFTIVGAKKQFKKI